MEKVADIVKGAQLLNAINEAYESKEMLRASKESIFYEDETSEELRIRMYVD